MPHLPWLQRTCTIVWLIQYFPYVDLRRNQGRCRKRPACPPDITHIVNYCVILNAVLIISQTCLFVGVQTLFFKAKTLNLVEVLSSFKRDYIVGTDSINWSVSSICGSIKCQCCFPKSNLGENCNEVLLKTAREYVSTLISVCCGLKSHVRLDEVSALNLVGKYVLLNYL